jgi:hypothetical protein
LDNEYFDLIFLGQFLYIPNVEDLSLTIYRPGWATPRVIESGSRHSWIVDKPRVDTKSNVTRSITRENEVPVPPKKVACQVCQQDVSQFARVPVSTPTAPSMLMWMPKEINRSRGLFKRPENENCILSIPFRVLVPD